MSAQSRYRVECDLCNGGRWLAGERTRSVALGYAVGHYSAHFACNPHNPADVVVRDTMAKPGNVDTWSRHGIPLRRACGSVQS